MSHPAFRPATLIGLGAALVATVAVLATNPTTRAPARDPSGALPEMTLEEAAPGVLPVAIGPSGYTPLLVNVATVTEPDGSVALVLRENGGLRQLRRLPKERAPEFAGMIEQGGRLVWLELTIGDRMTTESRLWTVDSPAAAPRMITEDMGDVAIFDRRDDLVLHDGEVSWVATGRGDRPETEIRTVPLAGGKVRVEKRDGSWSFAGWPWITTVNPGQDEPVELRNLVTGAAVTVPVRAGEMTSCSPAWCRSIVIGGPQASTTIEVSKPDGSERFRAVSGRVGAALVDIALLDRFEVYSWSGGRLVILDIPRRTVIEVAKSGVTRVLGRGTTLCWATGDNEATAWYALDLAKLIP